MALTYEEKYFQMGVLKISDRVESAAANDLLLFFDVMQAIGNYSRKLAETT